VSSFIIALTVDLAIAIGLTTAVVRQMRRYGSPTLLSYLFYLVSWNILVLYLLIFLATPLLMPESVWRGYLLFNSIFIIPLNALITWFFLDFLTRWLDRSMPPWLRWSLPLPFAAILIFHSRAMIERLGTEAGALHFNLNAPISLHLMYLGLLLALLYAFITENKEQDRSRGEVVRRYARVTVLSLGVGVLAVFEANRLFGPQLANAVTSVVLAGVNVGGWIAIRNWFAREARAVAVELAEADLSVLTERFAITPREREVIALVITGRSNREITEELFISSDTVKKHLYNAYRKLGVKNRVQLVNVVLGLTGEHGRDLTSHP